ncbi:MAG: ComEC family competence protein [Bacteroidales bacterium]|nr:ComEC family competence protein [Bacteroidales bacterium]MCF8405230.1 ComEC family competence protein [Bacteroidales bacterium]
MIHWRQFPFVRTVIPFIIGIMLATYYPVNSQYILFSLLGLLLISGIFVFTKKFRKFRYRWISGSLSSVFLFFAAFYLTILHTPSFDPSNILYKENTTYMVAEVSDVISERPRSYKTILRIKFTEEQGKLLPASGKLLVYFEKGNETNRLAYGDVIMFKNKINELTPPRNPGEFNYKNYLNNKGIYHSAFLGNSDWELLQRKQGFSIKAFGINIREKLMGILQDNGISGDEFAIASAILLGYDENLDADLKRQFSGAGAMHILCVSGLHVGIIVVILGHILFFLNLNRTTRILKVFLLILIIWSYAIITGLSPSVLRASAMFSAIVIGRSFKRKANIYNMLALSALALLLINPYYLWEVGFQLSYLAVFGIVLLFKPIYNFFIPNNLIVDWIWKITVVSFAATLSTLPLGIYYFDQFPNLFLLTNLIVIPGAMLVVYFGLATLAFSFLPFVSKIFGFLLTYTLKGLTWSVAWIEGLPLSTTRGIHIESFELWLILILLGSLFYFIYHKSKQPLILLLSLSLVLLSSFTFRRIKNLKQEKIIVYQLNKFPLIEFIKGKQSVLMTDSSLIQNPENYAYSHQGSKTKYGISKVIPIPFQQDSFEEQGMIKQKNFGTFGNKRLIFIDSNTPTNLINEQIESDYLILSGNPKITIKDILKNFKFKEIIADSSVPFYKVNQFQKECDELGLKFWSVSKQGAWVCNLKRRPLF